MRYRLQLGLLCLALGSCQSKPPVGAKPTVVLAGAEIASVGMDRVFLRLNCADLQMGKSYAVVEGDEKLGTIEFDGVNGGSGSAKIIRDKNLKKGGNVQSPLLSEAACAKARGRFSSVERCAREFQVHQGSREHCENVAEGANWRRFYAAGRVVAEAHKEACRTRLEWHEGQKRREVGLEDFCRRLREVEASGQLTEERGAGS
jgi:hypothetical protein